MAPAGLFGLDWSSGTGLIAGGFLGYGRLDADFGGNRGDYRQSDTSFGGFLGWYGERSWVNAQASYTTLDYDVTRDVRMGVAMRRHEGSTDGSNTSFGVNGGYEFGASALRHGPVAGLLWQAIDVDGFAEDKLSTTALAYSDQSVDSLVGSLGWQARYDAGSWEPYVRATWDHEFEDGQEEVFARLQTLPDLEYAVPGVDFDDDFGTLVLGARFDVLGFAADLGARTTVGQGRCQRHRRVRQPRRQLLSAPVPAAGVAPPACGRIDFRSRAGVVQW